MNERAQYKYVLMRYSPDAASGEALNVGVMLVSAGDGKMCLHIEEKATHRLSECFGSFSRRAFKNWASSFQSAAFRTWNESNSLDFGDDERPLKIGNVLAQACRDNSVSMKFSEERVIVAYDKPEHVLRHLVERYITGQKKPEKLVSKRNDDDIWRVFKRELEPDLAQHLVSHSVPLKNMPPIEFEHAALKGSWHLFQPLTFDFESAESVRDKAVKWVGYAASFARADEIGALHFLTSPPSDSGLVKSYLGALERLRDLPVRSSVIEEDKAMLFNKTVREVVAA